MTADDGATPGPFIVRWPEFGASTLSGPDRLAQVEAIFYEASATRSFATPAERDAFQERWLGRYIVHDPHLFYVALAAPHTGPIAGYLAGALDDPAQTPRFADIGYFKDLAALTARYPAHLHINLAPQYRSRGWGEKLVSAFAADARAAGAPGMHVVTGCGLRNVRFYTACGFAEVGSVRWNAHELVMLGRTL